MSNAEVFLEIAKADLKAAQCLYQAKLYPQAVFFLQQSIEKTFKAIGSSSFSETDLKTKIKHYPLKIFSCGMENMIQEICASKDVDFNTLLKGIQRPDVVELLDGMRESVELYNDIPTLESIPKEDLLKLLPDIIELLDMSEIHPNMAKYMEQTCNAFKYLILDLSDKNQCTESYERFFSEYQEIMKEMLILGIPLTFLALVVSPSCATNTRYPNQDISPLEIYNNKNPIVASFTALADLCGKIQERLGDISMRIQQLGIENGI